MGIHVDHHSKLSVANAQLIVVGAPDESIPDAIALHQLPLRFGRSRDNDIQLAHPLVSRVHCELFAEDGRLFVRDLDSLNGTFVGNQRIAESELRPGDLLTVGAVTFRAVYGNYDFERSLQPGGNPQGDVLDTVPLASGSAGETRLERRRRLAEDEPGSRPKKKGRKRPKAAE